MKYIFIILLILVSACPVEGQPSWTTTDTMLEGTWIVLHVLDWKQTLVIARNPHKFHELNPIIGKHPSIGKVNSYMLLSALVHPIISYHLPQPYRSYWQYLTISATGGLVIHNFNIGIKVRF